MTFLEAACNEEVKHSPATPSTSTDLPVNTQNSGRKIELVTPKAIKDSEEAKKRKWLSVALIVAFVVTVALLLSGGVLFCVSMPILSTYFFLGGCCMLMIDMFLMDSIHNSLYNENTELKQKQVDLAERKIEQLNEMCTLQKTLSDLQDAERKNSTKLINELVQTLILGWETPRKSLINPELKQCLLAMSKHLDHVYLNS